MWGDNPPQKIDQVRQNRFVFTTGSNDIAKTKVSRTVDAYRDAGIANTHLIVVPNMRQSLPGPSYFANAVRFLDQREDEPSE